MPFSSLPLDIQLSVFDVLQDYKITLHTCAVVCKAWLGLSRRYLFRKMGIYSVDVEHFNDFLGSSEGAAICSYVQHLKLLGAHLPNTLGLTSPRIGLSFLHDLLSKLPALRHLSLLMLECADIGDTVDPSSFPQLSSLDVLDVQPFLPSSTGSIVDIFRVVALFPSVHDFRVSFTYWPVRSLDVDETAPAIFFRKTVKIHTLVIDTMDVSSFLVLLQGVLRTASHFGPLHTISVLILDWETTRIFGRFLNVAGPNLTGLRLNISLGRYTWVQGGKWPALLTSPSARH